MVDLLQYPNYLACRALPSLDDETVEIEVESTQGWVMVTVPLAAVHRLNGVFSGGAGLAAVACRVEDRQPSLLRVSLPTETPYSVLVPIGRLARRVYPNEGKFK